MKLKKLLPIVAVASTAAVVAPLVTSCAKGVTVEWNTSDELPTITPVKRQYPLVLSDVVEDAKHNIDALDKATADYFEDLDKDPSLFAKDVINFFSDWAKPSFNASAVLDNVSVKINKINKKDMSISYEVNMNGSILDEKVELSIKANNVKFYVMSADFLSISSYVYEKTAISPLIFYLSNWSPYEPFSVLLQDKVRKLLVDDSWYIDYKVNYKESGIIQTTHMNKNNVVNCLTSILDPQSPEYEWILRSTLIQSSYLDIDWTSK